MTTTQKSLQVSESRTHVVKKLGKGMKRALKTGGRGKQFTRGELDALLDVLAESLPAGQQQWENVARLLSKKGFDRDMESWRNKFKTLKNTKKRTGDPDCPTPVKRAKWIQRDIDNSVHVFEDGGGDSESSKSNNESSDTEDSHQSSENENDKDMLGDSAVEESSDRTHATPDSSATLAAAANTTAAAPLQSLDAGSVAEVRGPSRSLQIMAVDEIDGERTYLYESPPKTTVQPPLRLKQKTPMDDKKQKVAQKDKEKGQKVPSRVGSLPSMSSLPFSSPTLANTTRQRISIDSALEKVNETLEKTASGGGLGGSNSELLMMWMRQSETDKEDRRRAEAKEEERRAQFELYRQQDLEERRKDREEAQAAREREREEAKEARAQAAHERQLEILKFELLLKGVLSKSSS
ncbi:hypothetical protein BDR26DRAFT_927233 [Obelidium mucronatum]|nr:hypothetical protein BDR26DRAFT_927233 [Obelidium mucronatum]